MELMELLKARYSMRAFSEKKIEAEKIDQILEAGRLAPTARNNQPQRYLVLQGDEALSRLKECTASHFNAPLAILICYDKNESAKHATKGIDHGVEDACIATTQMMLAVTELDLGSTWVGSFDHDLCRKYYKIPENIVPVALLPIGYPCEKSEPSPRHTERRSIEEVRFDDSF